jgi:hypothetical protein
MNIISKTSSMPTRRCGREINLEVLFHKHSVLDTKYVCEYNFTIMKKYISNISCM